MPQYDAAKKWLARAARDLKNARYLLAMPDPDYCFASFACQQSSEKSIKAFLAFHGKRIKKTHDLRELAGLVVAINPKLSRTLKEASKLTPYAVEIRYPDYSIEINEKTTLEAIKIAQSILDLFLDIVEKSSDNNQL